MVKQFHFDLTCDVTDDLGVNQICFSSMNFPGLSISVFAFPISWVVSELWGRGSKCPPPPAAGGWRGGPAAAGLISNASKHLIQSTQDIPRFASEYASLTSMTAKLYPRVDCLAYPARYSIRVLREGAAFLREPNYFVKSRIFLLKGAKTKFR